MAQFDNQIAAICGINLFGLIITTKALYPNFFFSVANMEWYDFSVPLARQWFISNLWNAQFRPLQNLHPAFCSIIEDYLCSISRFQEKPKTCYWEIHDWRLYPFSCGKKMKGHNHPLLLILKSQFFGTMKPQNYDEAICWICNAEIMMTS